MFAKRLLMAALLLSIPTSLWAKDKKDLGRPYRIKITSAGIPTLGGSFDGYKVRTKYTIYSGDKKVDQAYLNDFVYVHAPGTYTVKVNNQSFKAQFTVPPGMTQDRIRASWQRSRAVELFPRDMGYERVAIPSVWVDHPSQVSGAHNDKYAVRLQDKEDVLVKGVALAYPPSDIRDVDDGVLYSNTLIHLLPGDYRLTINGLNYDFTLTKGERRHLRLAALTMLGNLPQKDKLLQLRGEKQIGECAAPGERLWLVLPPSKYRLGRTVFTVTSGQARELRYQGPNLPGLRRPRLGIRAVPDNGVRITGFLPGSPVAEAGLKVGDRIVAIDGVKVDSTKSLARELLKHQMGESVQLSVIRPGREKPLSIKLNLGLNTPPPTKKKAPPPRLQPKKGKRKLF